MESQKVLIFDKNPSLTREIAEILAGTEIELIKTGSGNEAIDLSNRYEIALVLIEVDPEVQESFRIAETIRREKKNESLNILFIAEQCREAYSYYGKEFAYARAVDFIARSFLRGILKGKVESVINQHIQRKQLELELENKKIIERELKEARQLEEEAEFSKKQFLSTMSHEIRTPLNAIINTINLLISENPRKDQSEDMNVLKFSAENLLQLINDILDYSKIDSGRVEFEEIEFNLRKLVTGIQQSLQYGMVKKGITLEFLIEENVPSFLIGDSVRLAQIIFNLAGNALKFTEKGKVSFTASVYRDLEGLVMLKFMISDTGIGIPENKQRYIFNAFTQASASTTREYGGTGLGLAITKMLVEKQGGTIEVKSKPNEGSTFSVFMKFKKSEKGQQEEKPVKPAEIHSLENIHILVVEDNLINQKIVSRLLTKWNAITDTAENGRVAVQKVMHKNYQLVLMDLHMPEMNGYEATRKIRAMEGEYYKLLPILAVTASAFAEDRKKILDSGMNGYIIKPFHPVELNSKITHFLNQHILAE